MDTEWLKWRKNSTVSLDSGVPGANREYHARSMSSSVSVGRQDSPIMMDFRVKKVTKSERSLIDGILDKELEIKGLDEESAVKLQATINKYYSSR